MPAVLLPGLLPVTTPLWAVFTDADGKPVFERVKCLGIYEVTRSEEDPGQRVIAAFSLGEKHIEQADFRPNFVGLADTVLPTEAEWADRAKARCDHLNEKAANQKIIVPGGGLAVPGVHELVS